MSGWHCDSIDLETDSAMHVHLDLLLYHISVQLAAVKTRGVCARCEKVCAQRVAMLSRFESLC